VTFGAYPCAQKLGYNDAMMRAMQTAMWGLRDFFPVFLGFCGLAGDTPLGFLKTIILRKQAAPHG
jgi:hypothetical protein